MVEKFEQYYREQAMWEEQARSNALAAAERQRHEAAKRHSYPDFKFTSPAAPVTSYANPTSKPGGPVARIVGIIITIAFFVGVFKFADWFDHYTREQWQQSQTQQQLLRVTPEHASSIYHVRHHHHVN